MYKRSIPGNLENGIENPQHTNNEDKQAPNVRLPTDLNEEGEQKR